MGVDLAANFHPVRTALRWGKKPPQLSLPELSSLLLKI
jgi:hypothetical protein